MGKIRLEVNHEPLEKILDMLETMETDRQQTTNIFGEYDGDYYAS